MTRQDRHDTTDAQWDAFVRNFGRDPLRRPIWPEAPGEPMRVISEGKHYSIDAYGLVVPLVPIL